MGRITQRFKDLRETGRKALVPYVVAGDPNSEFIVPIMNALVDAGADIIELGMPFSDPFADGPINQRGAERALKSGINLNVVFKKVSEFRLFDKSTPIVLMGYLNPILAMGCEKFCTQAHKAGVDGLLIVDLPPESEPDLIYSSGKNHLDMIYLAAPTTTQGRLKKIVKNASGWLYYVSLKGVTGSAKLDVKQVEIELNVIRKNINIPVCVGFGIRTAEVAASLSKVSDGVIVGSVLVETIGELFETPDAIPNALSEILRPMRLAMDNVS